MQSGQLQGGGKLLGKRRRCLSSATETGLSIVPRRVREIRCQLACEGVIRAAYGDIRRGVTCRELQGEAGNIDIIFGARRVRFRRGVY